MLDAARRALEFLKGKTRTDLQNDLQLQFALIRCIEIIGEAASKTTPAFRASHPDIRWRDAVDMRNRLIHAYYDIDVDIVLGTLGDELPPLIDALEKTLEDAADNP